MEKCWFILYYYLHQLYLHFSHFWLIAMIIYLNDSKYVNVWYIEICRVMSGKLMSYGPYRTYRTSTDRTPCCFSRAYEQLACLLLLSSSIHIISFPCLWQLVLESQAHLALAAGKLLVQKAFSSRLPLFCCITSSTISSTALVPEMVTLLMRYGPSAALLALYGYITLHD